MSACRVPHQWTTALAVACLLTSGTVKAQLPTAPTNLKVLPPDIKMGALVPMMKGFTQALGVRCQHCHVHTGENPDDLKTFDFASDEKPTKQTARVMLRMVAAINNEHLKNVGEPPPPGETKVTCFTCHRGDTKPLTRRPEK